MDFIIFLISKEISNKFNFIFGIASGYKLRGGLVEEHEIV